MADPNNYYHKYHMVEVVFGGEEDFYEGRDKITKDIFYGEKKTENAQIFLENLEKSRSKHLKKVLDKEFTLLQ